jgi:hypothetical protein
MTHGPPRGILDLTVGHSRAGCPALLRHIGRMANPPRLHVFGHIHEARGALVHQWDPNPDLDPEAAVGTGTSWSGYESEDSNSPSGSAGNDGQRPDVASTTVDREGWKETIMVNAANQPAGAHRMLNQTRVPFGGPGFQPIIVDLLDKP